MRMRKTKKEGFWEITVCTQCSTECFMYFCVHKLCTTCELYWGKANSIEYTDERVMIQGGTFIFLTGEESLCQT